MDRKWSSELARPDADTILKDADKLKQERFALRDAMLIERSAERFNETTIKVPDAYNNTAHRHKSKIIEDEGRQVATLVYAMPVPHVTPPAPEDQPATTQIEKFLIALHKEAEARFGPVWWQSTLGQIHDNISWLYWGWRKVPYKGQPEAPDGENLVEKAEWMMATDRYKKDAGVRAFLDCRYVPTGSAHPVGNVYDPDRFYEIKQVAERDLMDTYGITKNRDGSYSKPSEEPTTVPSDTVPAGETMIKVVEYWDREWCVIVAETAHEKWFGTRTAREGFVLAEWEHKWGRVPYFARPAIPTEQSAEEKKYIGPLDGIYTEMPEHKMLRTMGHAVAYQTAFSPLQVLTKETGDIILDDAGNTKTFLDLEPGKARQLAPGQEIATIPQSPEVANLWREIGASDLRVARYSMPAVSKGESPGADTANAALSNLHRFNLTMLDPLAQQASRQASAMYRFALKRIRDMGGERVFVFDRATDSYLSLAAEDIVSVNVEAKVVPDQGQFQLLIEKHAMEMYLSPKPIITLEQMYEMMGKENPDELALEVRAARIADTLDPVIMQQITSDLGQFDAINAMMRANAETGSARNAVPGLMNKLEQANPTGMGQGSPGQPRDMGVRSPVVSETTQPALTGGV